VAGDQEPDRIRAACRSDSADGGRASRCASKLPIRDCPPRRHRSDRSPNAFLEAGSAGIDRQPGERIKIARQIRLERALGLALTRAIAMLLVGEAPQEVAFGALPAVEEAQTYDLPGTACNSNLAGRRWVRKQGDHGLA
jgi:hypothetical protein